MSALKVQLSPSHDLLATNKAYLQYAPTLTSLSNSIRPPSWKGLYSVNACVVD